MRAGHTPSGVHGDRHDRWALLPQLPWDRAATRLPPRGAGAVRRRDGAVRPHFFRPPVGHTSNQPPFRGVRRAGNDDRRRRAGPAEASTASGGRTPEAVVRAPSRGSVTDGAIVMLHDRLRGTTDFEPASRAGSAGAISRVARRSRGGPSVGAGLRSYRAPRLICAPPAPVPEGGTDSWTPRRVDFCGFSAARQYLVAIRGRHEIEDPGQYFFFL